MADVQVTCVTMGKSGSGHEAITHVGGPGGGGWKWTVAQVAASIRSKTNTFYTMVDGRRADIGVVDGEKGPYLRTYADKVWNDNLLALGECS
ncbi:DUF3892 domain-containing protein [Corallococcus exercitus]|uniref:DUF3892 domain-containing protein n=1 Tax=Corallococcus exercitus TaxID=2316736 RepID=A0A7Y4NQ13_9BACT|nr:DUF3892 domain-containing protein [Corallococcus exercitus]NOK32241.1 DUF3892 domain-containing protein [Corallococcus exercitus]